MQSFLIIGWFIGFVVSILGVYQFVGMHLMVSFFPEGKRWWQIPAQIVSLALFAAFVLFHPF